MRTSIIQTKVIQTFLIRTKHLMCLLNTCLRPNSYTSIVKLYLRLFPTFIGNTIFLDLPFGLARVIGVVNTRVGPSARPDNEI